MKITIFKALKNCNGIALACYHGRMTSDQFFCIFEIIIFYFVIAIRDLVHDVETISHLSYVLTTSGNLF